jgi:hypothetical protein
MLCSTRWGTQRDSSLLKTLMMLTIRPTMLESLTSNGSSPPMIIGP